MKIFCPFFFSTVSLAILSSNYFASEVQSAKLIKVTGKLIYPSEDMPAMLVCAVTIDSQKRFCVKTVENQFTFSMEIPPNDYIFSAETSNNPDYKAWMTSFNIDCGTPCGDNPIHVLKVKVERNTVSEICPCDWYTKKEDLIFPPKS